MQSYLFFVLQIIRLKLSNCFYLEPSFKDLALTFCSFARMLVSLEVQKWRYFDVSSRVHFAFFCNEISQQFILLSCGQYALIWASNKAYQLSIWLRLCGHYVIFRWPFTIVFACLRAIQMTISALSIRITVVASYLFLWTENTAYWARIRPFLWRFQPF